VDLSPRRENPKSKGLFAPLGDPPPIGFTSECFSPCDYPLGIRFSSLLPLVSIFGHELFSRRTSRNSPDYCFSCRSFPCPWPFFSTASCSLVPRLFKKARPNLSFLKLEGPTPPFPPPKGTSPFNKRQLSLLCQCLSTLAFFPHQRGEF